MGDMGGDFNALKKMRQEKRASNRDDSAVMLTEAGIKYEAKNLGAHLIVEAGAKKVDFWPGTGLWMVRGQAAKHRGVRKLMEFVALNGSKV